MYAFKQDIPNWSRIKFILLKITTYEYKPVAS